MTLNGAITQLAEIRNHPMCPVIFKPALNKVIETISELEEKLIETISELEEPCAQVLGESCEIEQYAETCEECGFCDNISRQRAGKAVAISDDWLQGDAPEMETVHLGDGSTLIRPIETQKETPC